ncbi:MAG: hypothetical protein A3K10_05885 [Bacteroidetes bacterium RIFCSPLOWO2_12_FULL_31_6]|nr:MAG: hypothetical protein A3K10_05885 [Bacteroidetes bacterium RIFCSPLOWO2_12_FULL_31_6]
MQTKTNITPVVEEFIESAKEHDLIYYASDAASKMEFEDEKEYQEAIRRAMEICSKAGIPLDWNFKKIYRCSFNGIESDWRVSFLGYKLVCMNGGTSNPKVALMQLQLLKDLSINEFRV